MNNLIRISTLGAFIGLAAAISAQPTDGSSRGQHGRGHGGHGHHDGPRPGQPVIRVLDNDHDGEISATELANAPSNLIALDLNSDGTVTAEELRPSRPAHAPTSGADRPQRPDHADHPRPVFPIMLALDADANGELSNAEIANATISLSALDLNGDGRLTADEFRPLPPEGAQAGSGRKGAHGKRGQHPQGKGAKSTPVE